MRVAQAVFQYLNSPSAQTLLRASSDAEEAQQEHNQGATWPSEDLPPAARSADWAPGVFTNVPEEAPATSPAVPLARIDDRAMTRRFAVPATGLADSHTLPAVVVQTALRSELLRWRLHASQDQAPLQDVEWEIARLMARRDGAAMTEGQQQSLPHMVELGLGSIFEFLKEAAKTHPALCVKPLKLLQSTLDQFKMQVSSRARHGRGNAVAILTAFHAHTHHVPRCLCLSRACSTRHRRHWRASTTC